MNEYLITYQAFGAMAGLSIATLLYSLGGRSGKWKRRFIASFVLAATVNILFLVREAWNPWYLAVWPCLIAGFSLGYGADTFGEKVVRRSVYASAILTAGVVCAVVLGGNAWWVMIPHAGIGALSIFLGVKNILPAAAEEVFICALLNIGLIMYPFLS